MAIYIIPVFIIFVLLYSVLKKINAYESFVDGARQSIDLCINTFPYLVAIFSIVELLQVSGLSSIISSIMSDDTPFKISFSFKTLFDIL